jgi:hypothetical protein
MHPKPKTETSGPKRPNFLVFIFFSSGRWSRSGQCREKD